MFCVERRKSWRMLQSKAGVVNKEYIAQKAILADVDAGKIAKDEFFAHAHEMLAEKLGTAAPAWPRHKRERLYPGTTSVVPKTIQKLIKSRTRTARSAFCFFTIQRPCHSD